MKGHLDPTAGRRPEASRGRDAGPRAPGSREFRELVAALRANTESQAALLARVNGLVMVLVGLVKRGSEWQAQLEALARVERSPNRGCVFAAERLHPEAREPEA